MLNLTTHIIVVTAQGTWARGATIDEALAGLRARGDAHTSPTAICLVYVVSDINAENAKSAPPVIDSHGRLSYSSTAHSYRLARAKLSQLAKLVAF